MINGRKPETGSERGQYCFVFRAPARTPGSPISCCFSPAASDALHTHCTCTRTFWGLASFTFQFHCFPFSPKSALLESSDSNVAADFCLNFCSQLTGFLLLWADLLLFWFPFSERLFIPSPGLSDGHLVLLWSLKHLPQRSGKWASFGSLKISWVWVKHKREIATLHCPIDTDQGDEPAQPPRDLELGCLLSHLQIIFFSSAGNCKNMAWTGCNPSSCSFPWDQICLRNGDGWRWKPHFARFVCKASKVRWERQMMLRSQHCISHSVFKEISWMVWTAVIDHS